MLKCLPHAEDFERKLPERFSLRQDVRLHRSSTSSTPNINLNQAHKNQNALYRTDPTSQLLTDPSPYNDPDTTTSPFLLLPYDILYHIFHALSHAPTQVCLLLTCKRLAQLLSPLRLTLSLTSAKYAGHLPLRVFDVPALLVQLPLPSHLRLCAHCLTMRPCPPYDEGYWAIVQGCGRGCDFWIQKTGWEFKEGGWKKQVHDICPMCHGSCSLGDFGDCDGCSALGRLGDVNWGRLGRKWGREKVEEEIRSGRFAT
jgi:hypothetical protein